jgi:predicted deacylase
MTLTGKKAGPTVVITANIHGDEVTGIGTIQALPGLLDGALKAGTLHLYPSLNPEGLAARNRRLPTEDQDLNRLFPGNAKGTPAERIAHAIWDDLVGRKPGVLIDLHTDSPISLPYAIVDRAVSHTRQARQRLEKKAERLARATGLTMLKEYQDKLYEHYSLDRSLSGAVTNRLGIPAVTIEAGPRLYLDTEAVETMNRAVLGVLSDLGMVAAELEPHPTRVEGGPWRRATGPRASVAGVLHVDTAPGTLLSKGDAVAEIHSLSGACLEKLVATEKSFVVSIAERAWVTTGVAVATLGVPDR